MIPRTCLVAAATLAIVIAGGPADASGFVKPFEGPDAAVTDAHLAPSLGDGEQAYEKYLFEAYFPDGKSLYWSASFSNLGPGDGKATVKSRVSGGGLEKRSGKDRGNKGGYTVERDPVKVAVGKHELTGRAKAIRLIGEGKGYTFDVTFTPEVAPYRPGSGRATFADGTYYDMTVLAPRARVTGTLTVDGREEKLDGYGYGLHTHSDIAPHLQAKRWVKLRAIDGATVVHMWEFVTPNRGGETPVAWLLVAHEGKLVLTSTDFERQYSGFTTDTAGGPGYRVPSTLVARASGNGTEIVLAVKADGPPQRTDELAKLSALERAVAKRFAKPIRYSHEASFQVKATGSRGFSASGKGARFEITHLNP